MEECDVGLDISTSTTGVVIMNSKTGELKSKFAIRLTSTKFKDVWDKVDHVTNKLQSEFDFNRYVVERIFVEEAHMRFTSGLSSAKTLFTLSRFNGIVSNEARKLFGVKPTMVNVRTARKKLGIKIDYKDKSKDTKTKVFDAVRALNPSFVWDQHVAKTGKRKGELIYDNHNFDLADAWVIAKGGSLIYPLETQVASNDMSALFINNPLDIGTL